MSEGKRIDVFLHDVERFGCITVDEEMGFIVRPQLDADGQLVVKDDEVQTQMELGKVRIAVSDAIV